MFKLNKIILKSKFNQYNQYKHNINILTNFKINKLQQYNFSVHIDPKDNQFFENVHDWWDPNGSMNTLHYFNDLRVKYISECLNEYSIDIKGKKIIDIGCGAGILTEVI